MPQLVLERRDFRSAARTSPRSSEPARATNAACPGQMALAKVLVSATLAWRLAFDHRVERPGRGRACDKRHDHGKEHRKREQLRIAQEVEHRVASIRADPDARTRGLPEEDLP